MWKKNWLNTFIGWIIRVIIGYRKDVVHNNISRSFNTFSPTEIESITKQFYVFIGKIIRELTFPLTSKYLKKHYTITLSEEVNEWIKKDKSVLFTMAHIGNWEIVGSGIGDYFPGQVVCFYRRIKNSFLDKTQIKRRSKFLKHLLESRQVADLIRILKKEKIYLMQIIDQNPGSDQGLLWTTFMNQPTAFSNASETIALRYEMPVVYVHVGILDNGDYTAKMLPIWDGVSPIEKGEITKRYAQCLEKNIKEIPYAWLWTHKRWKRKPPDSIGA